MSKVSTFFKAIGAVLRHPHLLSAALHDQRYWKQRFGKRFGHCVPLRKIAFSAFVPDTAALEQYDFGGDTSMITDFLLLKHLAMREDISSYLEIGTWRGATAATVAPHLDRVVTIDLDERTMRDRGIDEQEIAEIGKRAIGIANVSQVRSDSVSLDFTSLNGPFDLIFIDGDHRAEYVTSDTRNVIAHLCHDKTIVVWHDYGIDPENVRWEVYYGIIDGLSKDLHPKLCQVANTKSAIFLPIGDIPTDTQVTGDVSWEVRLHTRSGQ